MHSLRCLVRLGLLSVVSVSVSCGGGGNGNGADAGPTGPCVGTFNRAFPSDEDPQFCMLGTTDDDELALTVCGEVFDNCSATTPTPNFACVDTPPGTPPATPATVTMTGFVDVFSSGPNANNARVQVFRASQLDGIADDGIAAVAPIASLDIVLDAATLVGARACPKERDFVSTNQIECAMPTSDCLGACDKDLGAGQFCFNTVCEDLQRWEIAYSIPSVPTNEFLVIRSVGLDASGNPQISGNTWAPLFQYNVYLSTADKACADTDDRDCMDNSAGTPRYQADLNLLSSQDYMTIPTSAGLSAGISVGNGAIAGEIHDCDSTRIRNIQVGFERDRTPKVLAYFNGNPLKTLPRLQQSRAGTNLLGLYAGLDIPPGPLTMVATGMRGGTRSEIARFKARIWPDSTTLLRLGGGRPPQP